MKKIVFLLFTLLLLSSCNTKSQKITNTNNTYSKYQPIVINSFLLGGFFENKWIDEQKTFDLINITENYKTYKGEEYIFDSIGEKIKFSEPEQIFSNKIKIIKVEEMKDENIDKLNMLSISGNFEVFKRNIIKMKNDNKTYQKIIKDILIENDMKENNVIIKELYKFDIDFDEQNEYLIYASDIDDSENNEIQKKYSIIVLRKNVNGVPKNIFLRKVFYVLPYNEKNNLSEIVTIGDLNNDNNYEIVIKDKLQDSLKYSLYKLINNNFEMLLSTD